MPSPNETIDRLKELAGMLRNTGIISNSGPIDNTVNQLKMWKPNGRHPLKYKMRGLQFNVGEPQFIRGNEWTNKLTLKLDVDVTVSNNCFNYQDVTDLTINVHYDTKSLLDEPCKGAWHLDFHNSPEPTKFMHPIYHFHHGGKKLDDLDSYGNIILLDTPRVMHHPLDIFLAIDFVISNFVEAESWTRLRGDTRYQKIMEKAQQHWWKPYYEELGKYWTSKANSKAGSSVKNIAAARELNPHLI